MHGFSHLIKTTCDIISAVHIAKIISVKLKGKPVVNVASSDIMHGFVPLLNNILLNQGKNEQIDRSLSTIQVRAVTSGVNKNTYVTVKLDGVNVRLLLDTSTSIGY